MYLKIDEIFSLCQYSLNIVCSWWAGIFILVWFVLCQEPLHDSFLSLRKFLKGWRLPLRIIPFFLIVEVLQGSWSLIFSIIIYWNFLCSPENMKYLTSTVHRVSLWLPCDLHGKNSDKVTQSIVYSKQHSRGVRVDNTLHYLCADLSVL